MSAIYIKNVNNECLCNICSEKLEIGNSIGLKCDTKHIFCYECILDWYKESNKNKNIHTVRNMCPICRKNGGFLPVHKNFDLIKGIHSFKDQVVKEHIVKPSIDKPKSNKSNIIDINPNKLPHECGAKLKTKNGYCECNAKSIFGGFCGRHANYSTAQQPHVNNNPPTDINDSSSDNKTIANDLQNDDTLII
jgi:hypothetical protein